MGHKVTVVLGSIVIPSVPNGTQYGSISKVKELTDYTKYELKQ